MIIQKRTIFLTVLFAIAVNGKPTDEKLFWIVSLTEILLAYKSLDVTFDHLLSKSQLLAKDDETYPEQGRLIGHGADLQLLLDLIKQDMSGYLQKNQIKN